MKYSLNLTLNELYKGSTKEFSINHKTRKVYQKIQNILLMLKKDLNMVIILLLKKEVIINPELDTVEDLIIQIVEQNHELYKRKIMIFILNIKYL